MAYTNRGELRKLIGKSGLFFNDETDANEKLTFGILKDVSKNGNCLSDKDVYFDEFVEHEVNSEVDKFELVQKGLKYLKKDCIHVSFIGIISKSELPNELTPECLDEEFEHEYQDTKTDGFDDGSFWGSIFLPFVDDDYMQFDVSS